MKRIALCLLAMILVLTPALQAYAAEPDAVMANTNVESELQEEGQKTETQPEMETELETETEPKTRLETEPTTETQTEAETEITTNDDTADEQEIPVLSDSAQVKVTIASALVLYRSVDFTISLSGQESKTITLQGQSEEDAVLQSGAVESSVSFEHLEEGSYTLNVSAPGFATYSQELSVGKMAYTVQLTTGFVSGYTYESGNSHPGVLLIGDADGNGSVDDNDKNRVIDDIENDTTGLTDLNGDGETDLADLEYFTKGYQIEENTAATIGTSIPDSVITAESGSGTLMNENQDGSFVLKREDGSQISEENPVVMDFSFENGEQFPMAGIEIAAGGGNPIKNADIQIVYLDESGTEQTVQIPVREGVEFLLHARSVTVEEKQGILSINLGGQVAVKKVTITITGMKNNNNLAEISKVEFLNDMENRIPAPQMDIPKNLTVAAGNKTFTVSWDACVNVTGYEVEIIQGDSREIVQTKGNTLSVSQFNGEKLVNGTEYSVQVQSVNGTWRSGFSSAVTAVPKVDSKPDAPDNVSAAGKYRSIDVSWKMMEDTDSYHVYYRKKGTEEFVKSEAVKANRYTITGLKDKTVYEIYVTGVNELGESGPSLTAAAETTILDAAVMPKYHLINRAEDGQVSGHIVSASIQNGEMKDSPLDETQGQSGKTAWGTVDNNPASSYAHSTWDGGGYNNLGINGVTYEFDQPYQIETIALQELSPQSTGYGYAKIRYWDEQGVQHEFGRGEVSVARKTDSEKRVYYLLQIPRVITAKKIQIGMARAVASGTISVSEVYFYHYDEVKAEIMDLYADDLHTVLKPEVTQETIDVLRNKINTKEEVSGEYNPNREMLERELKNAEDILKAELTDPISIHAGITTTDQNRGFGGLNAWQPLGITAAAGEQVTLYIGHNSKKTGDNADLQLVATQYHAESSAMEKVIGTRLKVGKNEITIPQISSLTAESGGALYIQYTGRNASDRYAVRISGGVKVPKLDLYQISDSAERFARTKVYVEELTEYVGQMEALHKTYHENSGNTLVQYAYDEKNCILGASDILLDTMMFSLPAQQILTGEGSGSVEEKARQIVNSMDAMEKMMDLFYQHKGLNRNAADTVDRYPSRHLNIRYQRMFAGAFMYASGAHIGIEWNETKGMMTGVPVQSEDGKYVSGRYFGWGIAHEIGHCINQGAYAVAEVTNNYFAVLAQAKDTNDSVRFKYENVYDKVTSGTKGSASNVFTQLGMYWQLHLAYDNGYNFKTYETYEEQLANLFFARVDTYARTPKKAPAPGGTALTLSGNKDQDLMKLCVAAAGKDILDFFERWGMTPAEDTRAYAAQFEKESRAIYYVSDDARAYRLTHGGSSLNETVEAVGADTVAAVNPNVANQVDISLTSQNISPEDILGYEIVRSTISGGEKEREVVGFTTGTSYTDTVTTINNRTVSYEITLIDKYLNRSAVRTLDAVKIQHDGSMEKSDWTVSTTLAAADAQEPGTGDEDMPCGPQTEDPVKKTIDQDIRTTYTGIVQSGKEAEIILNFNRTLVATGLKYTVTSGQAIQDYELYVQSEEREWKKIAEGTFKGEPSQIVYFANEDGAYISTYEIIAVKLVIPNAKAGQEVAVSELDVLGVTGDNVDFRRTGDGTAAIGKLKEAYQYGENPEDVIPKDSIIFTGSYKGNPAYNTVLLYDEDGNILGGTDETGALKAQQIILADVPETGDLADTADGTWIYWIDPQDEAALAGVNAVRAELYRVNNALTQEGQRMVSDTLFEVLPAELPDIELSRNQQRR
ncbi:MAG: M60 family metallopeptidase [Clostridiales bacterium]|nr:M60 family metallopeptidase [Clostridiales bacterium]